MWFPRLNWKDCKLRSYGGFVPGVKIGRWVAAVTLAGMLAGPAASASDRALRIVALGDSLTAGYGLAADEAFPVKLQRALAAKGIAAEIANAETPPRAGSPASTGRFRTGPMPSSWNSVPTTRCAASIPR